MKKALLEQVLEQALEKALASLEARATAMVEEALGRALEARIRELLGEAPAIEAPTPTLRAKAKAQTNPLEATPNLAKEEAKREATPKPRRKKETGQALAQDDLETILEGVKVALQKYSGTTTPKGKAYSDVLFRRVKKVLEHAQENGRQDLALLARSALAHINVDPKQVAMSSWQALAGRLGLPVPVAQGGGE
jgi:hypothetical protein